MISNSCNNCCFAGCCPDSGRPGFVCQYRAPLDEFDISDEEIQLMVEVGREQYHDAWDEYINTD